MTARRIQQQQRRLGQHLAANANRFRLDQSDEGSVDRREVLGELQREREAEREALREFLAERAARRAAAAEELASLPEEERAGRVHEQNELRASSRLKMAESLRSRGRAAAACKWLQRLVDEYPETTAADEARELLAWLPAVVTGG